MVVYDDPIDTIFQGQISNLATYFAPDSEIAPLGLANQPLEDKRRLLRRKESILGKPQFIQKIAVTQKP